ncbi:hypothetical protein [Pedobacter endophyticus]|uniref:Uncharacterized protein n=1 Tax=Pedobacter endophyticus TaxID=2789740 RepID=A0A7U3Q5F4_9SPHI|nr:hypothetical protein [Pedobacter endophyticus]QPH38904.1 hypothetical protein IZT61_17830 [Pedobacter endophyticus]
MQDNLKVVNKHLQFKKVALTEPTSNFYLHIAAEVDQFWIPVFLTTGSRKKRLIDNAKQWCRELKKDHEVVSADVFKAILIPPGIGKFLKEQLGRVQIAKYDFAILIETASLQKAEDIKNTADYNHILGEIKNISRNTHMTTATNIRHINPVDHQKQGVFLFNYFLANSLQKNLSIWEYTAGWFQEETGLYNSTVLLPIDQRNSEYTIINHCRWNKISDILPSLIFKKSFHSYVLDNFYANEVAAMPILYKLA